MKTNNDTSPRNNLPNSDAVSGGDSLGRKSSGFKKGFRSRKIGPFTLLPNVSKFEVDLQWYDELYLKHGMKKRLTPEFRWERYGNAPLNRYLRVQLDRLSRMDDKSYWRVSQFLLCNSRTFFVSFLNHVFPKWHRDLSLKSVLRHWQEYREIAQFYARPGVDTSWWRSRRASGAPRSRASLVRTTTKCLSEEALRGNIRSEFDALVVLSGKLLSKGSVKRTSGSKSKPRPWLDALSWTWISRLISSLLSGDSPHWAKHLEGGEELISRLKSHPRPSLEFMLKEAEDLLKKSRNKQRGHVQSMPLDLPGIPIYKKGLIQYERAYIPKPSGAQRPLGVPTPGWRLFLHGLNNFMLYRLDAKIPHWQHGFRPGRGTLTAWMSILNSVLNAQDIYEFDYKSYFDNVPVFDVCDQLNRWGVPSHITNLLKFWSGSPAVFRSGRVPDVALDPPALSPDWIKQKLCYRGGVIQPTGFTQGSPLSPFLSSVASVTASVRSLPRGIEKLMYADDGVLYGSGVKEELALDHLESTGIPVNKEKSGFVKKDGVWLKEFKFLGMIYNGSTDELWSSTRSGRKLLYNKQDLVLSLLKRSRSMGKQISSHMGSPPVPSNVLLNTWTSLVESEIFGLIQSRLYQGSWDPGLISQDFELTFSRGSWLDSAHFWQTLHRRVKGRPILYDYLKRVTVFNSSSFASKNLCEILRGDSLPRLPAGYWLPETKSKGGAPATLPQKSRQTPLPSAYYEPYRNYDPYCDGFFRRRPRTDRTPAK